jgi:hypothetical protein
MRKLWLAAVALGLAGLATPGVARAGVDVSIGIGLPFPPVFVAPAPPVVVERPVIVERPVVYSAPVYYPAYRPVYVGPGPVYRGKGWHKGHHKHWKHHKHWD